MVATACGALAEGAHATGAALAGAGSAVRVVVHGATDGARVAAVHLVHETRPRVAHVGEALEGAVHRAEIGAAHVRGH